MKKILLILTILLMGAGAATAQIRYKGYVETNGGVFIPGQYYGTGGMVGFSTSHGVELFKGLFVGAGIDANYVTFTEPGTGRHAVDEADYSGNFAVFAEGRYNFLRGRRVSPFVGLRIGGGYEGVEEQGCFYFSPAVGVTINITKRFGLDASVGYSLWSSRDTHEDIDYTYRMPDYSTSFHGVAIRLGVHF